MMSALELIVSTLEFDTFTIDITSVVSPCLYISSTLDVSILVTTFVSPAFIKISCSFPVTEFLTLTVKSSSNALSSSSVTCPITLSPVTALTPSSATELPFIVSFGKEEFDKSIFGGFELALSTPFVDPICSDS